MAIFQYDVTFAYKKKERVSKPIWTPFLFIYQIN